VVAISLFVALREETIVKDPDAITDQLILQDFVVTDGL
jgi:hypothetical protein